MLTKNGASIHELNTIRKHLSQIKGGRLAEKAQPAKVIAFIISDVVGDNLDTIASGPTTADPTTWQEVKEIIEKYEIWGDLPLNIQVIIQKGLKGEIKETPKISEGFFTNVHNYLIANNRKSCQRIKQEARALGYQAKIISTEITGEAKRIGKQLATKILQSKKETILIAGGETTVTITGKGKGGRNQELVLAASKLIAGREGIVLASIGTDGKDGPTDAAGAISDGYTKQKGITKGLTITEHLQNNDSYNFFKKIADLIITGPTETNVMDLMIAIKV
jgi:glycerate-2-kinase